MSRWDEEAVLPCRQLGWRLGALKVQGENGHDELYHRDNRMRPGRQAERAVYLAPEWRDAAAGVGEDDAEGVQGVLRPTSSARSDRGGNAFAVGERVARGAGAQGDSGQSATGEAHLAEQCKEGPEGCGA